MSKKIRVGINGFGRIGRAVFRVCKLKENFEIVVISDLNDSIENIAYLMKYDSIHGTLKDDIKASNSEILINGHAIKVFCEPRIENVPWNDCLSSHLIF